MNHIFCRDLFMAIWFSILLAAVPAYATDGTWTGPDAAWTTGANWSSAVVPDDTATFANNGAPTSVTISGGATVGGMQFDADAPAYSFTVRSPGGLTFTGDGIGASSNAPTFYVNSILRFNSATSTSTAGNAIIVNNEGSETLFTGASTAGNATITNATFSYTTFTDSSDAGNATIINNDWGGIDFGNNSSANNATIINNGGSVNFNNNAGAGTADIANNSDGYVYFYTYGTADHASIVNNGGRTYFYGDTDAGSATITNENGGRTDFYGNSTADSATIITNDNGRTFIGETASGGTARFVANGTGRVDISNLTTAGTTAGSIEGSGTYYLGSKEFSVGSLDTDTTVSGTIRDGGSVAAATGGSLVKTGNGTLTLSGANSYTGGTTISAGTLQLGSGGATGSIVGDVLNEGTLSFNRSDEFTFDGAISGGGAVNQVGTGTTILTSAGNTYSGATSVFSGTLQAGIGNAFSSNSAITVTGAGILDLNGLDQTVAGLNNAGLVTMGTGAGPGTVLTVSGAYVSNGGTIIMNAVANEGGANSQSDMLVVDSTQLGLAPTRIVVNNVGGAGAATIGNGIGLVEVLDKSASADGVFVLGGRFSAGAYNYNLFHNGVDADAADGNWYLRSETDVRPEVPIDRAVPALAGRMGLAVLGTYTNRSGDAGATQFCTGDTGTSQSDPRTKARPGNAGCNTLLWGRVFGETGRWGRGGNDGLAYRFKLGGFQAGADLYRSGRNNAGFYVGIGRLNATIRSFNGGDAGTVDMNTYAIGGYWTYRDPAAWYIDFVLQGAWYEDIQTRAFGETGMSTDGSGFAASAEAGYALSLDSRYTIVPQAQLIYQRASISNAADAFSQIDFGATDELYGRIGGQLTRGWETGNGSAVKAWADANLWRRFGYDAKATFASLQGANPATFSANLNSTWAQLGLGVSGQVAHNVNIFGQADYNMVLSQSGHSFGGRAGFRVDW